MIRRLALLTVLALTSVTASAAPFVRFGTGLDRTRTAVLRDRDCTSTAPPALFGCGFEARGDFSRTASFTLGAGVELPHHARVELELTHRPGLALDATANFTGVTGDQPVNADAHATTALAIATIDVHRFFVSAGAGVSRNELDAVTYAFPGIAPNAVTITRGGTHDAFAWSVAAGTTFPITPRLDLDLALRYTSLGDFTTDAGRATIIRPTRTLELEIDDTRAPVRAAGVTVSLRWSL